MRPLHHHITYIIIVINHLRHVFTINKHVQKVVTHTSFYQEWTKHLNEISSISNKSSSQSYRGYNNDERDIFSFYINCPRFTWVNCIKLPVLVPDCNWSYTLLVYYKLTALKSYTNIADHIKQATKNTSLNTFRMKILAVQAEHHRFLSKLKICKYHQYRCISKI